VIVTPTDATAPNASTVVDRNVQAGREGRPAFLFEDRTITYGELAREVARAGRFLADLGIGREDRVLLILDDTPVLPALFLGAMRIGAVPVPVSPLDRDDNFAYFAADSYAKVVVAEAPVAARLHGLVGAGTTLVVANGSDPRAIDLAAGLAAQEPELDPVATHRDDMAFWLYSSGSTGRPKGVVHLHHDIEVTCETYAREVLGVSEDDLHLSTTKLYHAYGLGNTLSFPLHFGATAVLRAGPPRPGAIAEALQRHRPTLFFSVPALYGALLAVPDLPGDLLSRARLCVSAAEALPPSILERWQARFGVEILDGIGSTELLHIFCSNVSGDLRPGTSGRPVPGYRLRLVDSDGTVVEGEAEGALEVRGDSCAPLYWHHHEKTKQSIRGEWCLTGDRYRRAADGTYAYEGRMDDMLKVGGLWVSPVALENAIIEHPDVADVGVIGVTVDDASRIAAFVITTGRAGSDELAEELRELCKSRLRRYEYPHRVHFVDDLPRTLTGKVQRFRLREQARDL